MEDFIGLDDFKINYMIKQVNYIEFGIKQKQHLS